MGLNTLDKIIEDKSFAHVIKDGDKIVEVEIKSEEPDGYEYFDRKGFRQYGYSDYYNINVRVLRGKHKQTEADRCEANEIKIGGVTYSVQEIEGLAKEHDVLGQILYDNLKIKLDTDLPQDRKEETLIHEITHGIFYEAGYEEQDEDMINRVGKVLYQVIKDNPNLLAVVK